MAHRNVSRGLPTRSIKRTTLSTTAVWKIKFISQIPAITYCVKYKIRLYVKNNATKGILIPCESVVTARTLHTTDISF